MRRFPATAAHLTGLGKPLVLYEVVLLEFKSFLFLLVTFCRGSKLNSHTSFWACWYLLPPPRVVMVIIHNSTDISQT